MLLNLDVVREPTAPFLDRRQQAVRAIGEILPDVLAKYGIHPQSGLQINVPQTSRIKSSRFQISR
jgi:hypothetical protein